MERINRKEKKKSSSVHLNKKEISPCVALICTRCQFFKEDDLELECAAFKILKNMVKKGKITPEDITAEEF